MEQATDTRTYVSGDWEWNAERECYDTAYAVEAMAGSWNGFARPVVNRTVLTALVERQASVNAEFPDSERMTWEGDAVVVAFDDPDTEDVRLVPDGEGHFDLSPLGWTFECLDESDPVINRVG